NFQKCSSQLDSLAVTIQPDPLTVMNQSNSSAAGYFNISGSLSETVIDNNTLLVIGFGKDTGESLLATPYAVLACHENIKPPCPIDSRVNFNMEQVPVPILTDLVSIRTYAIIMSIGKIVNETLDVHACSYANYTQIDF
ncbi:17698_t:CDS:1, partial [Dentiscutata erythropus]